jgi:hypothetical protein
VCRCYTDRRKGGNEWAGGKMDVSLCGRKERKKERVCVDGSEEESMGMRIKKKERKKREIEE